MAVFNLNSTTGVTASASNSLYVVGVNAQVLNNGVAFNFSTFTNNTLVVNGLVASATSTGVNSSVSNNRVTVTQNGTIVGDIDAIALSLSGFVTNAGVIISQTDDGVSISGNNSTVENDGSIQAEDNGVVMNGDNATVLNTGSITALDRGVYFAGNTAQLINSGTIVGGFGGVDLNLAPVTAIFRVANSGVIQGGTYAIQGNEGDETIINSGLIQGDVFLLAGNDTFDGRGGTVLGEVLGGPGNDVYIVDDAGLELVEAAGEGTDRVKSAVDYTLGANFERLTLLGADDLTGRGNVLDNVINGNSGDNRLAGRGGNDTLNGKTGDDRLLGRDGADVLSGGADNDTLSGGIGNDTLRGQTDDDRLLGNDGNDSLIGSAGNDDLRGDAGRDTLSGGADQDTLTGGSGNDRFVFTATADSGKGAASRDVITDFKPNADTIDLSAIDARTGAGNQAFSFIGTAAFSNTKGELRYQSGGGKTLVQGDTDGDGVADLEIELTGNKTLDAGDFVL